jgi:transcriptional regulator with XRE-family HTH domain
MEDITLKNIGAALRNERGEKGLRQTAQEIGISPATLSRVEGGKLPDIDTFKKICVWMEVDAGEVLGAKAEKKSEYSAPMVHLKIKKNISEKAAKSLSAMILAANALFD